MLAKQLALSENGYRLVFNCNADGGQTVFHLHLHSFRRPAASAGHRVKRKTKRASCGEKPCGRILQKKSLRLLAKT